MISRQLQVGDYIFNPKGELARITKINKKTYSYSIISKFGYSDHVAFDGIKRSPWEHEEWFYCDDIQVKALELAMKEYKCSKKAEGILEETKELIGKAKYFLNQIEDIEEVEDDEQGD